MAISLEEQSRRQLSADESGHSLTMEGLTPSGWMLTAIEAFVRGEIELDELIARGRAPVSAGPTARETDASRAAATHDIGMNMTDETPTTEDPVVVFDTMREAATRLMAEYNSRITFGGLEDPMYRRRSCAPRSPNFLSIRRHPDLWLP